MSRLPPLRFGFDLPFPVRVTATAWSEPLGIAIRGTGGALPPGTLAVLDTHVRVFVDAALYGMGSGPYAPPRLSELFDSRRILRSEAPSTSQDWAVFRATGGAIDPTYVTVLLHKLRCLALDGHPLTGVAVSLPLLPDGDPEVISVERAELSDLPGLWPQCGFACDMALDDYFSSLTVIVDFAEEVAAASFNIVKGACETWAAQCIQGGFTSATYDCDAYCLVPGELTLLGDSIEWTLSDVDIDVRAFHSLANFFVAFSAKHEPVRRLAVG